MLESALYTGRPQLEHHANNSVGVITLASRPANTEAIAKLLPKLVYQYPGAIFEMYSHWHGNDI